MEAPVSLWPEFNFKNIRTPISILQEQANELGKRTQNILIGDIVTSEAIDEQKDEIVLIYQFYIKAPILSNYRYLLFRLVQRITLYPVDIYFDLTKEKFLGLKEDEFVGKLKNILNHSETITTINSLYAQSIQINQATNQDWGGNKIINPPH